MSKLEMLFFGKNVGIFGHFGQKNGQLLLLLYLKCEHKLCTPPLLVGLHYYLHKIFNVCNKYSIVYNKCSFSQCTQVCDENLQCSRFLLL